LPRAVAQTIGAAEPSSSDSSRGSRGPDGLVLVNLSGRGDKDVRTVAGLDGSDAAE